MRPTPQAQPDKEAHRHGPANFRGYVTSTWVMPEAQALKAAVLVPMQDILYWLERWSQHGQPGDANIRIIT
jgi:hypothetical protein